MTHHPEPAREAVAELLSHLKLYVIEKLEPADADMLHDRMYDATAALSASPAPAAGGLEAVAFQHRVQPWMLACFGEEISCDVAERNHRFLEEALELVQSTGCTASEAHQLVDYVFNRPTGETHQEIGGVMVTLAALCLALGEDMHAAAETELTRIWTKVEKIRAKQAAKPKHSPLPEHVSASPAPAAGGLEAVAPMPTTVDRRSFDDEQPDGYLEGDGDWANNNPEAVTWLADNHTAIRAALASPAAASGPTYVVNCCNCGRIIDTREESEGGDQWGHELSDDSWVCSPECLDAVTDPDAVPAATSAETQGGDGVREALGSPDGWREQREVLQGWTKSAFLAGEKVKDEAWHKRELYGDLNRLVSWLHSAEDAARAALAPSTSAATRGEPVFQGHECRMPPYRYQEPDNRSCSATYPGSLPVTPHEPAPAVESAQVKVKPLVWRARTSLHHCAETPFGSYSAYVDGGWKGPSSSGNAGGSFPEGRAAAEAQHQHDIRASLDLATDAEG